MSTQLNVLSNRRALQAPPRRRAGQRLGEPRRFIQMVTGARQVGKTTLVQPVIEREGLGVLGVGLSIAGLLAFNLAFHVMYGRGGRLERRRGHTEKLG